MSGNTDLIIMIYNCVHANDNLGNMVEGGGHRTAVAPPKF